MIIRSGVFYMNVIIEQGSAFAEALMHFRRRWRAACWRPSMTSRYEGPVRPSAN